MDRNQNEINILIDFIGQTRFFKDLKMKSNELKHVAQQLQHEDLELDNFVITHGSEGKAFYIVIEGKVSVWVPVPARKMLKPLKKFKERVKSAIEAN